MRVGLFLLLIGISLWAQAPCADTLAFSTCEITFTLNPGESWTSAQITAEVKSPRFRTFLTEAFWDGGSTLLLRVTPTDEGSWDLKLTSNLPRFDKLSIKFNALPSEAHGFIQPANVHHWRYTGKLKAHLWLGTEIWDLATAAEESFLTAKTQKATHLRTLFAPQWPPNPASFQAFEKHLRVLNADGIIVDIVLAGPDGALTKALPDPATRDKYIRYAMSRLAPYNVTWEIVKDWESYTNGRSLLKEIGALIKRWDPYDHPRSAYPLGSTAAFAKDGWMTHILCNSDDPAVPALEHQTYALPIISVSKRNSTKALWQAISSGSYLGSGATKAIGEVLEATRFWELEPYFDVSNGRALALEGTEYLLVVDRPGIVEMAVEKHGYDTAWINASSGESTRLKDFKGEHFIGEPPTRTGDWLLHLSREGRKEGMLKSVKFDSQPLIMQEAEVDPKRIPFDINIKDSMDIKAGMPIPYEIRITKDSRATRFMQYLITADVPTEGQGMRVISTQSKGTLILPPSLATKYPAVLNLRVAGMNANGKLYFMDRIVSLVK